MLFQTGGNDKSATIVLDRGVNAMYDVLIEFQVRLIAQIADVFNTYSSLAFGVFIRLNQLVRLVWFLISSWDFFS
jgi:hypothetical protein